MKIASTALKTFLATSKNFAMADLWSFALKNGVTLNYTNWDIDLTIGGVLYKSHDVILKGGKLKQTKGLEVNETELTLYPNLINAPSNVSSPGFLPWGLLSIYMGAAGGSVPFLQAVTQGFFDRAVVQRLRLFMPTANDLSLAPVRIFLGEITGATPTRNTVVFKCKDATNILNIQMPRRQYQPTCPWTFGDANCTFNKSALTVSGVAQAGSAGTTLNCSTLTQIAGYFNFGAVTFTSGNNTNVTRSVKNFGNGVVQLTGAFPQPLAAGDAFTITPGCSKNYAGQTQQFNASTTGTPSLSTIFTELTNAAGFFNGGTLQFTSGANVGQVRTIVSWYNGVAVVSANFPNVPLMGDEMTLTSISTNTQSTCTGYANTAFFGGMPFVPIPETAY